MGVGSLLLQHLIDNFQVKLVPVIRGEKTPFKGVNPYTGKSGRFSWFSDLPKQTNDKLDILLGKFHRGEINLGWTQEDTGSLLVVDVDYKNHSIEDEEQYFKRFEQDYNLIDAFKVRSANGGRHYYLISSKEIREQLEDPNKSRNCSDSLGRKIELKGIQGKSYVIAPGSVLNQDGVSSSYEILSPELTFTEVSRELEEFLLNSFRVQNVVYNVTPEQISESISEQDSLRIRGIVLDRLGKEVQVIQKVVENQRMGRDPGYEIGGSILGRNDLLNKVGYRFAGLFTFLPNNQFFRELEEEIKELLFLHFSEAGLEDSEVRDTIKSSWTKGYQDKVDVYLFDLMNKGLDLVSRKIDPVTGKPKSPLKEKDSNTNRSIVIGILAAQTLKRYVVGDTPYITIFNSDSNRREHYSVDSSLFRAYVYDLYTKLGGFASKLEISNIVEHIHYDAIKHGEEGVLYRRSALIDSPGDIQLHIQLGVEKDTGSTKMDRRYLTIGEYGFSVLTEPPVLFDPKVAQGFPNPQGGIEDLNRLWKYLNLYPEDRIRVLYWLISAFTGIGEYPILYFVGSPGSAKSSNIEILTKLIEGIDEYPTTVSMEDRRNLLTKLSRSSVLVFDNVSYLDRKTIDLMSELATGRTAESSRVLFTDEDIRTTRLSAAVILASLADLSYPGDFASRVVKVAVPTLTEKDREGYRPFQVEQEFREEFPLILGALCALVSEGIRNWGKFGGVGRLNKSSSFFAGCLNEGDRELFYSTTLENNNLVQLEQVENDLVLQAIVELMNSRETWSGSAQELLEQLNKTHVVRSSAERDRFPKNARALARKHRESSSILLSTYSIEWTVKKAHGLIKYVLAKLDSTPPGDGGGNDDPQGNIKNEELTNAQESDILDSCKSTSAVQDSPLSSSTPKSLSMQEPLKEESRSGLKDVVQNTASLESPPVSPKSIGLKSRSGEISSRELYTQEKSCDSECGRWKTSSLTEQQKQLFTTPREEGSSAFVTSLVIPQELRDSKWISLDLETTALSPYSRTDTREIRVISICFPTLEGNKSLVYDIHNFSPGEKKELSEVILRDKIIVGTNLGFDLFWLNQMTQVQPKEILDISMLVRILLPEYVKEHLTTYGIEQVNLESIAESFGYSLPQGKEYQKPHHWIGELSKEKYEYCIGDIELPISLLGNIGSALGIHSGSPEEFLEEIQTLSQWEHYKLYSNSIGDLIQISRNGLPIDLETLEKTIREDKGKLISLAEEIMGMLGVDDRDIKEILQSPEKGTNKKINTLVTAHFKKGGFPLEPTKTGFSIGIDSLNKSGAQKDPLYSPWVGLTTIKKEISTLESIKEFVDSDGRLHSILSATTSTLRMRSQEPNVQNLPRGEIRKLVKSPEADHVILALDYSSIEMRIAAALTERIKERILSGEMDILSSKIQQQIYLLEYRDWRLNLSELFRRGLDAHIGTALSLMERSGEKLPPNYDGRGNILEWYLEQSPEGDKELKKFVGKWRQRAKAANFGLLYGAGSKKLWEVGKTDYGLDWSEEEAHKTRDTWFDTYPEVALYQLVSTEIQYGRGADTYFKGYTLSNRKVAANRFAEINNYQDQGSGAEMILNSIHSLTPELRGYLINSVHDELVFEVPQGREEELLVEITQIMIKSSDALLSPWGIPSAVEGGYGKTWGDCK